MIFEVMPQRTNRVIHILNVLGVFLQTFVLQREQRHFGFDFSGFAQTDKQKVDNDIQYQYNTYGIQNNRLNARFLYRRIHHQCNSQVGQHRYDYQCDNVHPF